MSSGERLTFELSGGAPWGFRLFGGDEEPLIIAKLRKKSKAHNSGLQEEDVLLAINGKICRGMGHPDAMSLVDSAKEALILQVLRGTANIHNINAAYDAVVQHLIRPPPASARHQLSSNQPSHPTNTVPYQTPKVNGEVPSEVQSSVKRERITEGGTTRDIVTEQSKQQFGSTQITRVRREVTVQSSQQAGGVRAPVPVPTFQVPKAVVQAGPKPSMWSPGQQHQPQPQQQHQHHQQPQQQYQQEQQVKQPPKWAPQPQQVQQVSQSRPSWTQQPQTQPKPWSGHTAVKQQQPSQQPQTQPKPWSGHTTAKQHQPLLQQSHKTPSSFTRPTQQHQKPQQAPHPTWQQQHPPQHRQPQAKPGMWVPPSQQPRQQHQRQPQEEQTTTPTLEADHQHYDHPPIWGPKAVFAVNGQVEPPPAPKPNTWQPQGQHQGILTIRAPDNVMVQQSLDNSVLMTIGMPDKMVQTHLQKENRAPSKPVPHYKIPGAAEGKYGVWQPSLKPDAPPDRPLEAPIDAPPDLPPMQLIVAPAMDKVDGNKRPKNVDKFRPLSLELSRILQKAPDSDEPSTPDSTSTGERKKKLYSDSAFYTNPGETYPTVEEQMKMAKRVAMQLMAPANEHARGHQMFIKRRRKSDKWTTESSGLSGEKSSSGGDLANIADFEEFDDPNRPLFSFRIPQVSARSAKIHLKPVEKRKLNKQDLENVRLFDKRNMHNNVAPQVCFSIAEALQTTKGKGGKIFAKRRAKSESWVVDESNVRSVRRPPPISAAILAPEVPSNRLQNMINAPKPKVTPWEAALTDPTLEEAFEHLNPKAGVFSSVQEAALLKQQRLNTGPPSWMKDTPAPSYPIPQQSVSPQPEQNYRNFNRKVRGWGGAPGPARRGESFL